MHRPHAIASTIAIAAFSGAASADFTGFAVDSSAVDGRIVYRLYAQFDQTDATVLRAFNIHAMQGDLAGFMHDDLVSGGISTVAGSWNPNFVLGSTSDSFLTIGGTAMLGGGNTTLADAGWVNGWNTAAIPDLASTGIAGWYNHLTENLQGRADAEGRVLLGQFVLAAGHDARTISLRISHNTGFGTAVSESAGTFTLVPAPGALALLALAGVAARRRR